MNIEQSSQYAENYHRNGFLSPVLLIDPSEAASCRTAMEVAEEDQGPLHYISKIHRVFSSAALLALNERVLDVVEALIGPDIMLFDVTYIVKEPGTVSHVSWHQDLTYWGFEGGKQVSMWLALSTADEESGCMKMVPGSHLQGKLDHQDTVDPNNVLHRGQTVAGVVEEQAIACTLKPGEASFHDSWTLHASQPNKSSDRRIGLNVQYMTPDMKQTVNPHETSLLVRGQDHFNYYQPEILSAEDFSAEAMASHAELDRLRKLTWEQAS